MIVDFLQYLLFFSLYAMRKTGGIFYEYHNRNSNYEDIGRC